jgi:hypothetical protein
MANTRVKYRTIDPSGKNNFGDREAPSVKEMLGFVQYRPKDYHFDIIEVKPNDQKLPIMTKSEIQALIEAIQANE